MDRMFSNRASIRSTMGDDGSRHPVATTGCGRRGCRAGGVARRSSRPSSLSPVEVPDRLCTALDLDLIGPSNDSPLANEALPQDPSRWYLTGFLAPRDAAVAAVADKTQDDELDSAEQGGTDDAGPNERGAGQRARFPSSIGLSIICAADARAIDVVVRWDSQSPPPGVFTAPSPAPTSTPRALA